MEVTTGQDDQNANTPTSTAIGDGVSEPNGELVGTVPEIAAAQGDSVDSAAPTALSKRQQKKLKKFEKRLQFRAQKRAVEKSRRKERRSALLAAGVQLAPSRAALKLRARHQNDASTAASTEAVSPLRIAVDFAYDEMMSESEIRKAMSQLSYCYAANRRAQRSAHMYFVGLSGRSGAAYDRHKDRAQWSVSRRSDPLSEVFPLNECVYLTGDSDNVVDKLDESKVYVIGGLLDHNRCKGASLQRAQQLGVEHARLPIDRYIKLESRAILAINHVCCIMLKWLETGDWQAALVDVIPKRKGVWILDGPDSENGDHGQVNADGAATAADS